jgi:hypothetical protein
LQLQMRAGVTRAILGPRMSATVAIPPELDTIAMRWQLALDAADDALAATHGPVQITNADGRRHDLVQERRQTAQLLDRLGRLTGVQPLPWLSPVPVTTKMLGLPAGVTACLFDLDGVLTDSGALHGVSAVPGARRYLEASGHAGLKRAVVSASSSTLPILELAGLASVVEERVDADVIRAKGLRSRPAPDLLLAACRRLGVRPEDSVTLTHSAAGIAAGRAAGLTVIAVGDGADCVVPSLRALLDPRLQPPS